MDKNASNYNIALDIIEHPDNYTSEQLVEILSDPETRETYNLLCKAGSAVKACTEIDMDSEWENFAREHIVKRWHPFQWFGSRAASIAVIAGTSLLAVAAGITATVAIIDHNNASAAKDMATDSTYVASAESETIITENASASDDLTPVMFENESLETIMDNIEEIYGVDVIFNNKETASLRLYFKVDPELSLSKIIEQLNTFEQINIEQNGNTLTID